MTTSLKSPKTSGSWFVNLPDVVSREQWLAARKKLLAAEKEMPRARDALNAERRRLPMVKLEKNYVFEGADGKATLHELFASRRQLIVYHMMSVGCPGCSLVVDNIAHLSHLHARDTTLVVISRAPWPRLAAFWKRMAWAVPCYSSEGSDFNRDFGVTLDKHAGAVEYNYRDEDYEGEAHGVSVYLREANDVFHTYSTYGRGTDILNGTFNWLDLTALGRQEDWEQPPGRANASASGWWRLHDEY
jgi:predicted dithiol-disulfide oxidoreductase (DUF899 family)